MRTTILLISLLLLVAGCSQPESIRLQAASDGSSVSSHAIQLDYPDTFKSDHMDEYFGTQVPDPYRWLEDDLSEETAAWVQAQNEVTFNYLEQIPFRDQIRERITEHWNYERVSAPVRHGNYYYFTRNDGLQNHSVIFRSREPGGEPKVFLDPNTFSEDGTTSLAALSFTQDGTRAAWMISEGGSDWRKVIVIDTDTMEQIGDTLIDIKFSGISWLGNDGFFYSSYEKPDGSQLSAMTDLHKLYYHQIGTPQSEDVLVFGGEATPRRYIWGQVTEDQRLLIVRASIRTFGNELYIMDLAQDSPLQDNPREHIPGETNPIHDNPQKHTPGDETLNQHYPDEETLSQRNPDEATLNQHHPDEHNLARGQHRFVTIVDHFENDHTIIDTNGDRLLIRTNLDAPNYRLIATDIHNPTPENWVDVIPETDHVLSISTAGGYLFASYLIDVQTRVMQYDYDGNFVREVALPSIGTAFGFSGKKADSTLFYTFTSFTYPSTIFQYDIRTGRSERYWTPDIAFDPDAYITEQVFFESKDGTRVPMFITYKKGLEMDGSNPAYLFAYGGFNVSLRPSFSVTRLVWLENGGIYAQPNIRGGGEYGEAWHLAGTRKNRQNVFDDFIAAAEHLFENGYTSPEKLAIAGGSNGGLLVGAVMTQRPDLAAVAFPAVGVLDMLRYHTFTAGAGWAFDYGTAEESEEMFRYLLGYSPVHNVRKNTVYPSTMITTADHDDRVVPAHSFKFAAELQSKHAGENPVLIRIETRAGHGAGRTTESRILEWTDRYAFAWFTMGINPFGPA